MKTDQHIKNTTVHAEIVGRLLKGAVRAGMDVDDLLKRCDINPLTLHAPNHRVPVENTVKLFRLCSGLMQDELIGLLDTPLPMGYFRMALLSTLHQSNLGKALQRFFEFNDLISKDVEFAFNDQSNQAEITFTRAPDVSFADDIALDYLIMCTHRMASWLCNESIAINEIEFDHAAPSFQKEYQHIFFGASFTFNATRNRITFDKRCLALPIVRDEAAVSAYYQRAPLGLFLPQDVRYSTKKAVRKIIKQKFAKQAYRVDLQEVSQMIQLGEQTIRRRLAKEGTSFNCIKTQVKQDIAMSSLSNPQLSLEEISIRSGYSKPAAFIRAFKTWTGFSPARFRKGIS